MPLQIVTVPCLADNYAYLAHDVATGATAVIDVPEAAPVLNALAARGWRASHILITHHHGDHIEGVEALAAATGARVIGAAADAHRLPPLDEAVAPGDTVRIGMDAGTVIDVPGHTIGHIAYHFPASRALFTGDSLMVMGCGRLFEGSPAQMWDTLCRLSALPDDTRVFSGHEYAATNARFALSVEPDNPVLNARADEIARTRGVGGFTVPATLAEERASNPFLRAGDPALKAALGMAGADDIACFTELRARRNVFTG
jgi:hydroxyacylglutathione hydrolase